MINAHPHNNNNNSSTEPSLGSAPPQPATSNPPALTTTSQENITPTMVASTQSSANTNDFDTKKDETESSTIYNSPSQANKPPSLSFGMHHAAPAYPDVKKTDTVATAATPPSLNVSSKPDSVPNNGQGLNDNSGKRNPLGWKGIAGVVVLLLMVIGGVAAYYLQTQNQDTRNQAFYPDWGSSNTEGQNKTICDGSDSSKNIANGAGLNIKIVESPSCPAITAPNGRNPITNYSATYTLTNESDYDLEITYKKFSNYCKEPYSVDNQGHPGCFTETLNEQVVLNLGHDDNNMRTDITIPGQGGICGSWQTDLNIIQIKVKENGNVIKTLTEDGNSCLIGTDVDGWTMCQTGQTDNNPTDPNSCELATTPQASSCDSLSGPGNILVGGQGLFTGKGKNVSDLKLYYATQGSSTWTEVTNNNAQPACSGENCEEKFTWAASSLPAGSYTFALNAMGTDGKNWSGNPNCTAANPAGCAGFLPASSCTTTTTITAQVPTPTPTNPAQPTATPTSPPPPPVGAMCLGLCGAIDSSDFGNCANGAISGTPDAGKTLNLRCDYKTDLGAVRIFVTKDTAEQELSVSLINNVNGTKSYTASYVIPGPGTFSARCQFNGEVQPATPFPTNQNM